jgi:Ca2+:H+ antiporter
MISIGIMAATAEWVSRSITFTIYIVLNIVQLVESIDFVRGNIKTEYVMYLSLVPQHLTNLTIVRWFGLVLLPFVAFAADGFVAITHFGQSLFHHFFDQPAPPAILAKARAIDLSIQFVLFWMPFLVLLGWWTNKPMHLLFGTSS